MGLLARVKYFVTGNTDLLVEDTYNGLMPDDPIQVVDQTPELIGDDDAPNC